MSITKLNEVKEILGIADTDTSKDTLISSLLDPAENFVFEYTNNLFELFEKSYYIDVETLTFNASARTITDSASGFITAGLKSNVPIRVQGSFLNDGVYRTADVAAGTITLADDMILVDEAATSNHSVKITMMRIPKDVKEFIAKFIEYHFNNDQQTEGVKSESFGAYSVSYADKNDLPPGLLQMLHPYRCMK